jgi:hypothetical protein
MLGRQVRPQFDRHLARGQFDDQGIVQVPGLRATRCQLRGQSGRAKDESSSGRHAGTFIQMIL